MVLKFHHALTDGVGGVQIGMILFDLSEAPERHDLGHALPDATRRSGCEATGTRRDTAPV